MRGHFARIAPLAGVVAALAFAAAGCGGGGGSTSGSTSAGSTNAAANVSGSVSVMGTWTGAEKDAFQAVIDVFTSQYPNVSVDYTSAGDQLPTQLATAVQGGSPPDVAFLPQPGLMKDFVNKGALQSLDFMKSDVESNLGDSAVALGSVNGTLYGFLFKAANKSTVWYNVDVFDQAGVQPPQTWDDLMSAASTIQQSGTPAWSIGAADGWTLTDLFENIYLRQAGADMYDKLSTHEIPWTDQSVKDALKTMAEVFKNTDNIAGNALQTDFPTSVQNVFSKNPKAAMVAEGDFVPGVVQSPLKPETGYNVFAFPSINGSGPAVVGGGDTATMFNDSPAAEAFMKFLTTSDAAAAWAKKGGFASLNKNLDPSVYPDMISQETAGALSKADVFRFDMSDLQPAAFGGTVGQGEFKLFQDFYAHPDQVDMIAQELEASAKKAYGG